jgi:hypothetical protein
MFARHQAAFVLDATGEQHAKATAPAERSGDATGTPDGLDL